MSVSALALSLIMFFSFHDMARSAPHPGMGSSIINQLHNGPLFSLMGFRLNVVPSGWNLMSPDQNAPSDPTKNFEIELGKNFSTVSDHTGRISFKSEQTLKKIDLETYVKKYLRDYNQYGFDVSGLQSLREKNSVIVDINQKNKKTRSRQMFFQNGTRIVMATCVDEFDSFDKTIVECNQIFGGLSWK